MGFNGGKMNTIGSFIRYKRKEKGMTQFELAVKMGQFSSMFVSLIENGRVNLPLKHLVKICKILGIKKEAVISLLMNEYSLKIERAFK